MTEKQMNKLLYFIRKYCRGKENAILREDLLKYCKTYIDSWISDRDLRKAYAKLPVCTCEKGVFWPIREAELEDFRGYLRAKAIPMFERWRMVAQTHSHLLSEEFKQMELW